MTDTDLQAVEPAIAATPPEVVEPVESAPTPDQPQEAPEPEKPRGVQKRLDELTRNWREAERREKVLLDLLNQRTTPEPPAPQQQDSRPKTLADFEYDEGKYQTYLFEQATAKATEAARKELEQERARAAAEQRKSTFQRRESDFAKTNPDYLEVTRDPSVPITNAMAEVIAESEDGPAVAYYLAKNIAEAERIAGMGQVAQARELGRIEATLAFERKQAEEAKKRVSQAPPPAPKLEGVTASTTIDPASPEADKLSFKEWSRLRNKQLAKRRG